jgi:hypothetical protein
MPPGGTFIIEVDLAVLDRKSMPFTSCFIDGESGEGEELAGDLQIQASWQQVTEQFNRLL